jgi:hypothetical protein
MTHHRRDLRKGSLALASLTLLLVGGCGGRAHLTDSYGRASRAAFTAQAADPNAGAKPHKLPGLDAQEAHIVVGNYHRALTARGSQTDDRGMLILAPPEKTSGQPYMPPPSVPEERR